MVEEIDAVGAADAGVGVAVEEEKTATVAELGYGAIIFTGGVEEEIARGVGVAAPEVLEELGIHEIPLLDFGIEGGFVVGGEQGEVHRVFGMILDRGLELKLHGGGRRFLANSFESFASLEGLEEAGSAVELWRGPERRRRGCKRKSEGDFFTAGERLPANEEVSRTEGLVLNGEEDALIFGIGGSWNAVEGNGAGNELPEALTLGFVFWSSGDGVGTVFGFNGFGLAIGDQSEMAGRDTTDLIAWRERKRAIVDLVDGNFFGIGEGNPTGFAFDFIEECDGKRSLRLGLRQERWRQGGSEKKENGNS